MTTSARRSIRILVDTGDIALMRRLAGDDDISGVTTNPALVAAAGVVSYPEFCREVCRAVPSKDISLEVLSEEFETMRQQAEWLSRVRNGIYVKVPIRTTQGESTLSLVESLSRGGIRVNVTAVFTVEECAAACLALNRGVGGIVSLFAGRLADGGHDPERVASQCAQHTRAAGVSLLWASTRELFNITQAERSGCDLITISPALLERRSRMHMDIGELSRNTVQMLIDAGRGLRFDCPDGSALSHPGW